MPRSWKSLNHPDRLKYPMIRRNGKLERATWAEAMTLVVDKARDAQRNPNINEDYVAKHTIQRAELEAVVKGYPPQVVSRITGVPQKDIRAAADILGRSKSLLSTALQRVYQSNQATASACAIKNINLLLGHIGRPGAGIYQMNGQPTAQNDRETGCDGEVSGFRNYQNADQMRELADLWNIEYEKLPFWNQPTHIENMLKFIADGSIQMFWINGTNPLVSLPNLQTVRDLLTSEDLFAVAQDIFPNETTAIADVVLPAAAQGEKTGSFTNIDRTVHLSQKAVAPGEVKSDFEIFCDFSKRMGFRDKDGKPLISWTDPSEAFEAWKKMSTGRPCDYSGLSYREAHWWFWHSVALHRETYGHDLETWAPYTKEQYAAWNPAGRAILKPCHYMPELEAVNDDYPLQLSTGRPPLHFHTRTKTGRTPELQRADPEPYVQIDEKDAKKLGVNEGDLVVVESRRGKVGVEARNNGIQCRSNHNSSPELSASPRLTPLRKTRFKHQRSRRPQSNPRKNTAKRKLSTGKRRGEEPKDGFLEYWLGSTFFSIETLLDICDHLIPRITHADYEFGSGMAVMHRITTSGIDELGPATVKYRIERRYGKRTSLDSRKNFFPDKVAGGISGSNAYDILIALQSFYLSLALVLTMLPPGRRPATRN
ncbi:hypothetical protein LTR46_011637 [Exophiala xenobiotica]|nr:hypothetical protein LTR46_011637 [Exophiala xenobiotica]